MAKLGGVQVEDVGAVGVVAEVLVVAGEAEDVVDPEGGGPQDVALQGDAVAVPGHHLQDRLQAHELDADARGQAAHAAHRGLVVGDVDGVHVVLDQVGLVVDHRAVGAPGRTHLRGDGEVARGHHFLEFAGSSRAHMRKSSLTILRGPPSREVVQSLGSTGFSKRSNWPRVFRRS